MNSVLITYSGSSVKLCAEINILLWILSYYQIHYVSGIENFPSSSTYLDIYTNTPNLETVLQEETDLRHLRRSLWKQKNNYNEHSSKERGDYGSKYPTNFIQIQSSKHADNIEAHKLSVSEPHLEERSFHNTDYSNISQENSHVQKIQRRVSSENSKQLETSGNIFTRINSALKEQFARFFKLGNSEATTAKPYVRSVPRARQRNITLEKDLKLQDKKRFLNIFTILQFDNSRCLAQGRSSGLEGTCYHRLECAHLGGVNMGACAKDYGVCCIFRYTCGDSTHQNVSYFECEPGTVIPTTSTLSPTTVTPVTSTNAPNIDPRLNITAMLTKLEQWHRQTMTIGTLGTNCTFTVYKKSPDVRQLRIDFIDFDLRGPTNGKCLQDRFVITGQNINSMIPVICGYNTGQHLYVDVSDVPGPIILSVMVANPQEKRFRIKVSQLRSLCAVTMNCMQYYTGVTGNVQTLNYEPSPRGFSTPQYFNNMNYAICIRKEAGYCTITYRNVQDGVESVFNLRNVDANGNILMPPGQAGAEVFNCPDDYIVLNGVRLCGDRFNDGTIDENFRNNAPVTDTSGGPFVIPVRSNENNVGRGFKLFYSQNKCLT